MAGTQTAPVTATNDPNETITTFHLIDASGDNYTEAFSTLTQPALADIDTLGGQYQACTQASLWGISQFKFWYGEADPDNAESDQRNSIKQGINLLYKNPASLLTYSPRVVAPIPAIMQGNQDIPLLSQAPFPALITGIPAILLGYALDSAQYTERKERKNNPRIKA